MVIQLQRSYKQLMQSLRCCMLLSASSAWWWWERHACAAVGPRHQGMEWLLLDGVDSSNHNPRAVARQGIMLCNWVLRKVYWDEW